MIFLLLLPGYLLVNLYIAVRLHHWTKSLWPKLGCRGFTAVLTVIYFTAAFSPMIAFVLPRSGFAVFVRRVSAYWMGVLLYFLMAMLTAELFRIVLSKTRLRDTRLYSRAGMAAVGGAVVLAASAVCIYGAVHARDIKTTEYEVTVNKQAEGMTELKAVLIADTHMGYAIGRDHISDMVDKINACEPDIVIFAGDIFDNSTAGLDYPDELAASFRRINAKYGVWATYGNHDIDEKILMGFTFRWGSSPPNDTNMREFCEKAGINLLCDESVLIDNSFYLVGRRDHAKPGTEDGTRKTPGELTEGLDKSKPVFFIAHEPDELSETAEAGADIDFSGHTHDGQLFPLTLITDLMWENSCGMIQKGEMYSIVTSGAGVFGPFMRVGTDAEICDVTIRFNAQSQ